MSQQPEEEFEDDELELFERHRILVDKGQSQVRIDKFLTENIFGILEFNKNLKTITDFTHGSAATHNETTYSYDAKTKNWVKFNEFEVTILDDLSEKRVQIYP